jgi:tetratricopeptide (TPR) repeat protein
MQNDLEKSLEKANDCLEVMSRVENPVDRRRGICCAKRLEALIGRKRGIRQNQMAILDEAEKILLDEVLPVSEQILSEDPGDINIGLFKEDLGDLYLAKGDLEYDSGRKRSYYEKALNIFRDVKRWKEAVTYSDREHRHLIATSAANLGECFDKIGDFASSYKYYEESYNISREERKEITEIESLEGLFNISKKTGRYYGEMQYAIELERAYLRVGDIAKSIVYGDKVQELRLRSGIPAPKE